MGEEPTHDTGPAKRWRPCTPAMAAGLTDHVWTLWAVLHARMLINCCNTGSQKARQCRRRCSESVQQCMYVAQSMGETPQYFPGNTPMELSKVLTNGSAFSREAALYVTVRVLRWLPHLWSGASGMQT